MLSNLQKEFKIRTKTGCSTCRARKVKCDETKPECSKCTSTGRKCDGYKHNPSNALARTPSSRPPMPSARIPASVSIVLPVFDDDDERRAFAFFVNCTSFVAPVYYGNKFWAHRVLQMSLSEPAIRNAVCSLSSLHRAFCSSQSLVLSPESTLNARKYAFRQYNKAVSNTQKLLAESLRDAAGKLEQGLVACVLFVCYENLIGNHSMAQTHLQHGLNILSRNKPGTVPPDIVQVFQRLDLQAMSYADAASPYSYSTSQDHVHLDLIKSKFLSIDDAMSSLIHNFRWIFRRAAEIEPQTFPADDLNGAMGALKRWATEFDRLLTTLDPPALQKHDTTIKTLRIYSHNLFIIISTGVYGEECRHDAYTYEFEQIIKMAQALCANNSFASNHMGSDQIFSFEIGIILPLFYTAIKCRHRRIRREAIALLNSTNHQEGSWSSIGAARVAQFVMELEESLAEGGEIYETARVHLVTTRRDIEKIYAGSYRLHVSCLLRSNIGQSSWYFKEGELLF